MQNTYKRNLIGEGGWGGGGWKIFGALFSKKVPFFIKESFLANIERCPKFLEYTLLYIVNTCQ